MGLLNVPAGKELPDDIYVVIEIPANADPIKYEVDKDTGAVFVEIGRASCRERVEISVGAVSLKKKKRC